MYGQQIRLKSSIIARLCIVNRASTGEELAAED